VALERTLDLLPDTLRKANTTFVNLRSTLDDLDRLVAASKPATRELAPFLRELRPVVREAAERAAPAARLAAPAAAQPDQLLHIRRRRREPRRGPAL
jgi:phospholipid/cholesterol/gamma-HCH transport system substrate-binding protein